MHRKKKLIAGLLVFVFLFSIVISYYYYFVNEEENLKEEPEEEKVIDDRINPLVNQGLVLEILRIRHRGLLEKFLSPGNAWRTEPTFYFISNIDGLEYISRNVAQHGRVEEVYFNTWDSIFQENKIVKDAEEEQETSVVSLQIVEVVKKGILGLKTEDIVRDEFTVKYDYRTGRWIGDDNLMDEDGYGYYLGETFEIWFNLYQMDYDYDYIPYWTEVNVLGTDPQVDDSKLDPDNDGIPTDWEWKWGYDPFTWDDHENLDPDIDGLENIEEYQMAKWFADPYIKNVYVEVDFMEGTGLLNPTHVFPNECQQGIIERYAEHNIKLIFDDGWPDTPQNGGGEIVMHYDKLSQDSGMLAQYYYHHFPKERRRVFRYLLIGDQGGFNHPSIGNVGDSIYVKDLIVENPVEALKKFVMFGVYPTKRGQYTALASVIMHEMGHSIGLSPVDFEGNDNITYGFWLFPTKAYRNTWTNYRSVMNYQCIYNMDLLDYSDGSNGEPYDQNDWENIFVPTFQYNKKYIEESTPEAEPTLIVLDSEERFPTGYTFNENLTNEFIKSIKGYSPVNPIDVEWKVFQIDDKDKNSDLREITVFVKPKVPAGKWVLTQEGDLGSNGEIQFYSQKELFNQIEELITQKN